MEMKLNAYDAVKYKSNFFQKVIYDGVLVWQAFNTSALVDFDYTKDLNNKIATLTGWKGTYNGSPSTICKVPEVSGGNISLVSINFRNYANITETSLPESLTVDSKDLSHRYAGLRNLKNISIPASTTSLYNTFSNCPNVVTAVTGNVVTNMGYAFRNCTNLVGTPVCGPNVREFAFAYENCRKLVGPPVSGVNVTDMNSTYSNCRIMSGNPACGNNVTNMYSTYRNCRNVTGTPVCGTNVTNMDYAYMDSGVSGTPVCGGKVTSMVSTYSACRSLTGAPAVSNSVTNMCEAYYWCSGITGAPKSGPNVLDMKASYQDCTSLTGAPVCGDKVTNLSMTYYGCTNITGKPVCGNNVIDMSYAYFNCTKLTGPAVVGPKVTNASNAYRSCTNIKNAYIYTTSDLNVTGLFANKSSSTVLNIFVQSGSAALTALLRNTPADSIMNSLCTYTAGSGVYYNTFWNVNIYPVANVAQRRTQNGD